jgi:methylamine dehydrogenase accessory protein MauD
MEILFLISSIMLWLTVLLLGFLLLGALRAVDQLRWRLEQLEATTPSRMGRSGLRVGKKAPDFTLPSATGGDVSLQNYAGRKLFLVFTQAGCGPCQQIVPDLNRLHDSGKVEVLAINKGETEATRKWVAEAQVRFPVAMQPAFTVSKRYEVFATPFAFLIDEQGLIASRGIVNSKQQIGFVLDARRNGAKPDHAEPDTNGADNHESENSHSLSRAKELSHD